MTSKPLDKRRSRFSHLKERRKLAEAAEAGECEATELSTLPVVEASWWHVISMGMGVTGPCSPLEVFVCVCARVCVRGQLCSTLWDPMESSPPGPSVHGIFQARILEWVAISYSRGSSQPGDPIHGPALAGRFFTTAPPGFPGPTQNRHLFMEWISSIETQRLRLDSSLTSLTDVTRCIYPKGLLDEREKYLSVLGPLGINSQKA